MPVRQYIGARYVPVFADPIEWNNQTTYEALTIVTYLGASYTSRKAVPAGILPTNNEYWAVTGNYNAQVEEYRQQVVALQNQVNALGQRPWCYGKKVAIFGDSTSTGRWVESNFIPMAQQYNMTVTNYSKGGWTLSGEDGLANTIETLVGENIPDIIFIMLGVNDQRYGIALGNGYNQAAGFDTFSGALALLQQKLTANFQNAYVFYGIPLKHMQNLQSTVTPAWIYNYLIEGWCYRYNHNLIDTNTGVPNYQATSPWAPDNLHPAAPSYPFIAQYVFNSILGMKNDYPTFKDTVYTLETQVDGITFNINSNITFNWIEFSGTVTLSNANIELFTASNPLPQLFTPVSTNPIIFSCYYGTAPTSITGTINGFIAPSGVIRLLTSSLEGETYISGSCIYSNLRSSPANRLNSI